MVLTPHLLGFKPRNKIVLVTLSMEGVSGTGPIVQCDLAEFAAYSDLSYVVMQLVLEYKITGIAIDWYGDDLTQMCDDMDVIYHIDAAARQVQTYMSERYRITGRGYVCAGATDYRNAVNFADFIGLTERSFLAAQSAGIVVPYRELTESPMNTELVYSGSAPLDYDPMVSEMRAPMGVRADAVTAYRQCINGKGFRPKALWKNAVLKLAAGAEVSDLALASDVSKIGRLNAALADIKLRDSLLIYAINPQIKPAEIFDEITIPTQLEEASYNPVSQRRITEISELLKLLAAYSADEDPSAYAALAYLCWWTGKNELAAKCATQAIKSDPQYSLARLVDRAVTVQLPSPWLKDEGGTARSA